MMSLQKIFMALKKIKSITIDKLFISKLIKELNIVLEI
jgi:hypothetical protein